MKKFEIVATEKIRFRGTIMAKSEEEAEELAEDVLDRDDIYDADDFEIVSIKEVKE